MSAWQRLSVAGETAAFRTESPSELAVLYQAYRTERRMLADLLGELRPTDRFFDIGSHVGIYSCFAAERIPPAQVYAFDPYEPVHERWQANHERNGSSGATLVSKALADGAGSVEFDRFDEGLAVGGRAKMRPEGIETAPVTATTGDELVSEDAVPSPTVLKIDVEGAELRVLDGFAETIERGGPRLVYCEVHEGYASPTVRDYGDHPDDVDRRLSEWGFDLEVIERRDRSRHLKASR